MHSFVSDLIHPLSVFWDSVMLLLSSIPHCRGGWIDQNLFILSPVGGH